MQQNVHSELLALMFDHLVDADMQEDNAKMVSDLSGIGRKAGWTEKYITDSMTFALNLGSAHFSVKLAAAIVYLSVFNSSIFTMIFYLSKDLDEPLLPGLVHATAKLRQDMEMFTNFYLGLQKHIVNKVPQATISAMIREAVSIERDICQELSELIINSVTLGSPIEFENVKMQVFTKGDAIAKLLRIGSIFNNSDPLPWVQTAYAKERDRYNKHEVFISSVAKAKKEVETESSRTLSFNMDF
jgi:ribonucleotide reductase beta subunit family protein with ferritin-like domain